MQTGIDGGGYWLLGPSRRRGLYALQAPFCRFGGVIFYAQGGLQPGAGIGHYQDDRPDGGGGWGPVGDTCLGHSEVCGLPKEGVLARDACAGNGRVGHVA